MHTCLYRIRFTTIPQPLDVLQQSAQLGKKMQVPCHCPGLLTHTCDNTPAGVCLLLCGFSEKVCNHAHGGIHAIDALMCN